MPPDAKEYGCCTWVVASVLPGTATGTVLHCTGLYPGDLQLSPGQGRIYAGPMVDLESPVPLYVQLANIIREQIRVGVLTGRVPSVRHLAQDYGVAQVTATRAIKILKDEGLIITVPGKGAYVKTGLVENTHIR